MSTRDNFISKCLFAQKNILLVNMINSQSLTCVHFDPPGSLSQPALPCPLPPALCSGLPQHQTKSPNPTPGWGNQTITELHCPASAGRLLGFLVWFGVRDFHCFCPLCPSFKTRAQHAKPQTSCPQWNSTFSFTSEDTPGSHLIKDPF